MIGSRITFSLLIATTFMIGLGNTSHGEDVMDTDVLRARSACRELGEVLKGKMQDAVQRHSFTGALAVCREAAPALASDISEKRGLTIRRTSMKVRNPGNRADAWEQSGLASLEAGIAAGADPSQAEVYDRVTNDEGDVEFRYLKAIIVEPLCLSCHGEVLDDTMTRELLTHYPHDEAVGYRPGNLRGAFSVTLPSKR